MSHRHLLTLLGSILIVIAVWKRAWALLLIWPGLNFIILGVAHGRGNHHLFGKRSDGTLPLGKKLLFLPLLVYTSLVWHLFRICSREPATNIVIAEKLVIGRRLLAFESDRQFENYVDLTAEFTEPRIFRSTSSYCCFPILDGAAPSPEALRVAVRQLRPGRTFIHCAQGHGRTGLFALAMLLHFEIVQNVEEGLRLLQAARPGVRLNREQYKCIQAYAKLLTSATTL